MDEGTHTVAPAGEPVTAIVMAGGGSRRMKTDKSLLLVNGQTMVEHVIDQLRPHFSEILIHIDARSFGIGSVPFKFATNTFFQGWQYTHVRLHRLEIFGFGMGDIVE